MDLVTAGLSRSVRRAVQGGLAGVWVRGPLPGGGAVLAPSHHSWWDGYVLYECSRQLGQPYTVLMSEPQLTRYPFLRRLGAVGAQELRPALRTARAGHWVVVFPEGQLRPAAGLAGLLPGAGWLAQRARVPLVPVALRVVLRGQQWPEAYLSFGAPVPAAELPDALGGLLTTLDHDLQTSDPEAPLAGYLCLSRGRLSQQQRLDLPSRALARLTGDR
ncbi:lysophospholipid acyltransferase family protein [Deinococcus sonorensis]|uniref:Lysophospholipid acyltransferase family protein n=2 Tax=Deinococcus sonorensis TaxID=309891 RepID=A0AAU7UEF6_9DEIO